MNCKYYCKKVDTLNGPNGAKKERVTNSCNLASNHQKKIEISKSFNDFFKSKNLISPPNNECPWAKHNKEDECPYFIE